MYFQFTSHLQLVAFNEKTEFYQDIVLFIIRILQSYRLKLLHMFKIKLSGELIIYPVKL